MGTAGLIIGTVAGQFAGSWAYWRVRGRGPGPSDRDALAAANRDFDAAWAAGVVTTLVASVIYISLGVHTLVLGDGTSWGFALFLGGCMGLCQGMLFRGRPWRPRPPTRPPSK